MKKEEFEALVDEIQDKLTGVCAGEDGSFLFNANDGEKNVVCCSATVCQLVELLCLTFSYEKDLYQSARIAINIMKELPFKREEDKN